MIGIQVDMSKQKKVFTSKILKNRPSFEKVFFITWRGILAPHQATLKIAYFSPDMVLGRRVLRACWCVPNQIIISHNIFPNSLII